MILTLSQIGLTIRQGKRKHPPLVGTRARYRTVLLDIWGENKSNVWSRGDIKGPRTPCSKLSGAAR